MEKKKKKLRYAFKKKMSHVFFHKTFMLTIKLNSNRKPETRN